MKNTCIIAFLLIFGIFTANAQDLIILRDGNVIEGKVAEISPSEIRYRRLNHLDGPMIVIPRTQVMSIRYQNGTVEVMNTGTVTAGTATAPATAPARQQVSTQSDNVQSMQPNEIHSETSRDTDSVPVLGPPNVFQLALNLLPAIPIAGNNLKFEFGGDAWLATVNGRNLFTGYLTLKENDEGSIIITLQQTHSYGIRWMKTPGAEIVLEYNRGPPSSLKFVSRSRGESGNRRESRSRENRESVSEDVTSMEITPAKKLPASAAYLNSIGGSLGTTYLTAPLLICTLHGTYSPFRNSFIEMGIDFGWLTGMLHRYSIKKHFSIYPHIRYAFYLPIDKDSGWFLGAGCGVAYTEYSSSASKTYDVSDFSFLFDFSTGFMARGFTISYSLRTNFQNSSDRSFLDYFYNGGINGKLSVGYLYRFKGKGD